MSRNPALALAITGASGAQYAMRLAQQIIAAEQTLYLMLSDPAHMVLNMEMDLAVPKRMADKTRFFTELLHAQPGQIEVFGPTQWTAPVASGSNVPRAMVVCPCSMGTLAAIATGSSKQLIDRAADVVLKERRQLIIVPRESPVSAIHLSHMLSLTQMGAVILPANPGFYERPTCLMDLIDFVVARILDHLEIDHALGPRWGGNTPTLAPD